MRPNTNVVSPKFLHYYFLSPIWRGYTETKVIVGATVNRLPVKDIPNFTIDIPESIKIQQKIASILSAYDDLIENNRRRIQLLEESARQLYKEWFVRLRFPGHEHVKVVDGVPEGWITKGEVADLGEIVTGKTPSKSKECYYGNDILFIKTPDMHGNTLVIDSSEKLSIEGAGSQRNKSLPPRSIMVSCIGSVGVVAFNAVVAQTNQQINSIVIHDDALRYWAFFTAQLFTPILEGMGGGATMANVNKSKFSSIKIDIPSRDILQQFSRATKPLIDQIEQLTKTNLKLAQARDLLLPKLMSDEVAV